MHAYYRGKKECGGAAVAVKWVTTRNKREYENVEKEASIYVQLFVLTISC